MEKIEASPKMIIIGPPLNEIATKIKDGKKKGKDETIKQVIEAQNKLVNQYAEFHTDTVFVIVPPFLRKEPTWMEEKMRIVTFYVKDFITMKSPSNVALANAIPATEDDLLPDNLHLNESGLTKMYESLKKDIQMCKVTDGDSSLSEDWAAQLWASQSQHEPPTPATVRKRVRVAEPEESDDEGENEHKKLKMESTVDKMYLLMKEMKSEAANSRAEFATITTTVNDVQKDVTELKEAANRDTLLTAEIREDMDGLENENLKAIVVIRKLKATKKVPKDSKALRTYIQDLARELVGKILNADSAKSVKYAATLFSFIDPTKKDNKEGLVPPFKICFHTKDSAVRFREAAVKAARAGRKSRDAMETDGGEEEEATAEPESEYKDTYFTYFQTAGTRVRVSLMWAVADALKNKTKQVWVNQGSRPTLQIKEGGKIVRNLSFVKTMAEYKEKIPIKVIEDLKKSAGKAFAGQLEKTFIVLKD